MILPNFILTVFLVAFATAAVLAKTCPLYSPPKNGALACNYIGVDPVCVVMCNDKFDFVFNPPMLYYCHSGKWQFYSLPGIPFQKTLPWPDCSNTANPSFYKMRFGPYFFFNGEANDPNVQAAIKTKYISLMAGPFVPPPFCRSIPADCNQDTVQLYVGASTVLDQEPPVFTYCPNDIVMDNGSTPEIRVNWQQPTVTDNSGVAPSVTSNRDSGELFSVPGSYEVIYTATDGAGNKATCSFRITLKAKTCPLYSPPNNGVLACNYIGVEPVCVVMCNDKFDFVFNPPMLYYCHSGKWQFYSLPGIPFQKALPWPDCSNTANPSFYKIRFGPYFFFNGEANDPNVQAAIKTKYISLMAGPFVPPPFCRSIPADCNKDTVQLYVGASTV
ncbi:sushi, von Willebrand factor type A, EGF and pentraxin domain-containing protein 1-like [Oculina patagonica]